MEDDSLRTCRCATSDELNLSLDGWEGPLDLLLNLARGAEGRPRANLDPRAGRAISRLSRRGAGAEAGDRRRLSRDGGVARLPQILPAAAQGPRGRPEPRGNRAAAADAAAAARRDARGRGAAARPRPASAATCSCAARPKGCGWSASRHWQVAPFDLFAAYGAVKARTPAADARRPRALGDDAGGSDRAGRADDRHGARLDRARGVPARSTDDPQLAALGARVELRRGAGAGAPRPARDRAGRAVRADQAAQRPA